MMHSNWLNHALIWLKIIDLDELDISSKNVHITLILLNFILIHSSTSTFNALPQSNN